jgi:hypothetical protein
VSVRLLWPEEAGETGLAAFLSAIWCQIRAVCLKHHNEILLQRPPEGNPSQKLWIQMGESLVRKKEVEA